MVKRLHLRLLLLFFIIVAGRSNAQIKIPPINNFTIDDYNGGNQNWSVDNINGITFIANNEGLLEFDGMNWYLYRLPNKTIVRSVKVVADKIFTGSYEEFGFWERINTGELKYTSLSKELSGARLDSQSIWDIYELNGKIIFKSFALLYIYHNNKIQVINPNSIIMAAEVIDGRFIVQRVGKGLFELIDNKLVLLKNTESIANYKVQSILSLGRERLMIGTSLNGCYVYDYKGIKKWNGSVDNLLKENQLNTITHRDSTLYFGTIKNGVYRYDLTKNTYQNYNIKNGLQNNTILYSKIDDSNILWLALDNGISTIPLDFNEYYLNPFKENIGAVYDIAHAHGKAYLATNTGIFKIDNQGIYFIEGSQGHTWSLTQIDEEIICGHNSGTYTIENDKLTLLSARNGGYVFKPLPEFKKRFIQGNYSGLTLYNKSPSGWQFKTISGINFPVKNIVFENSHTAWVAHAYKGVYRIQFSENFEKVLKIEDSYNASFSNIYDMRLYKAEGNIAFHSNENWYVFNAVKNTIESFESLHHVLGKDKNAVLLNDFDSTPLVFKNSDKTIFIRRSLQDSLSQRYIPGKYYYNKLVKGEGDQKAVTLSDSLVYIALYNDVLVINTNKSDKVPEAIMPLISRIYKNDKLQDLGKTVSLRKNDTLRIEVNTPYLTNNSVEYSFDNKHWNHSDGNIMLTGLSYGAMALFLRSFINLDEYSKVNILEFYVEPPWYFGIWGLLLALALIILMVYLITTFNKYILIKHKKYLEEQYIHEQEIHRKELALKNEKEINELLKRQHETELNSKTKELANTAMEMTKKDELLEAIKSELHHFKSEIINKTKFTKLLDTINKNINTSKDWEVFESNFNEIHDSFFKSLVEKHSNLTPKDLKLCAYLKMNLSTKEIAPLMGISNRGVEIHRYRLRKKLHLDTDQNLNEYLMGLI